MLVATVMSPTHFEASNLAYWPSPSLFFLELEVTIFGVTNNYLHYVVFMRKLSSKVSEVLAYDK